MFTFPFKFIGVSGYTSLVSGARIVAYNGGVSDRAAFKYFGHNAVYNKSNPDECAIIDGDGSSSPLYIYNRISGTWTNILKYTSISGRTFQSNVGTFALDGDVLAIPTGAATISVFRRSGGAFSFETSYTGNTCDLADGGNMLVVGGRVSGSDYVVDVYRYSGGSWSTEKTFGGLTPSTQALHRVATDGTTIVCSLTHNVSPGTRLYGAVYSGGWPTNMSTIASNTNSSNYQCFGISGSKVVVTRLGSYKQVYVYQYSGSWSLAWQDLPVGTSSSNNFGNSCAIGEGYVFVGEHLRVGDTGILHCYTDAGSYIGAIVHSGTNGSHADDYFSGSPVSPYYKTTSISISGGNVLVGAGKQDYDENGANYLNEAGAVLEFSL